MKGDLWLGPVPPTWHLEGSTMGGKPNKGTKRDRRLKENKRRRTLRGLLKGRKINRG